MNIDISDAESEELHILRSAISFDDRKLVSKMITAFKASENPYLRHISERKPLFDEKMPNYLTEISCYVEALLVDNFWDRQNPKRFTASPYKSIPQSKLAEVPGTNVIFSVFPVTFSDFWVFTEATKYNGGSFPFLERSSWKYTYSKGFLSSFPRYIELSLINAGNIPVFNVSWLDAKAYCNWYSLMHSVRCRLPTQAEWRKASGYETVELSNKWISIDRKETILDLCIKVPDNLPMKYYSKFYNVGEEKPNAYGLHDFGTIVSETCDDWIYRPHKSSAASKASWGVKRCSDGIASPGSGSIGGRSRESGFRCVFEKTF